MRFQKCYPQWLIGMLFMAFMVIPDCSLAVPSPAQSNDADPIHSLVGRLFELYQQKDLDKVISLWSEKSPFLAENKNALELVFSSYAKIAVKAFDIRQAKIEGNKATLRVVAEMALTRAGMVKPVEMLAKKNRTIELVNEGGVWKLWKLVASEEELATAIIAAETEEARQGLLEKEPELATSDLAAILARNNTANIAHQKGYQHALAINQLATRLAEKSGDQLVIGVAACNAGYIYGRLGTPEKSPERALEHYGKCLRIAEEFGFSSLAYKTLLSLAMTYESLGDHSHAIEYYEKSLKMSQEVGGDTTIMAQALTNLGNIYLREDKFNKALEAMEKSLKLTESESVSGAGSYSYWVNISRIMGNIGITFNSQGNIEQALSYFQKAYEASQKAGELRTPDAKDNLAIILGYIGFYHFQRNEYSLAMEYYQKSLKQSAEAGDTLYSKDRSISWIKSRIADLLVAEKKTEEAIPIYQEALQLAEKSGDNAKLTSPLGSLSRIHLLRGEYREALAFAERAAKNAEQVNQPYPLCGALEAVAQVYQKLSRFEEAREALAKAIDILEQVRDQSAGNELDRQRSFEYTVSPYQAMIDLQIEQERFAEAFSYAQRAKAHTLLELLQNGRIDIEKSASPAEREQEREMKGNLRELNRRITNEQLKSQPDENHIAGLQEQLRNARLDFDAFQTTLYTAHPELKVERGEIRPLSFDDAADLIPDAGTALLDFIVTDEYVHLFVLTKDAARKSSLNSYTIKVDSKTLAEKVERLRTRMANEDYDFQSLSREIYELLIKPARKQLQGKTNLIISPDNVLWNLPFQVLLSPKSRYLIEDAAISYAPSLSVLREMRLESMKKRKSPAKASLLALGNPTLGNRSVELAKYAKMDADLQPLPEAAAQVRALGRLYGATQSKIYTGSAAREEVVKEQSSGYRILHLATHGILNDVSPMYSNVMLSQTPGRSDEDGLLEAWEMMNLDLNADLVVLAACETARGRVGAGEGVIGMTWALFVAGCPRTVVSQWKVEAASTTALMVEFHKRFRRRYGVSPSTISTAEAMREAALKVMRTPGYAHPFYWGGFVVVGDGN